MWAKLRSWLIGSYRLSITVDVPKEGERFAFWQTLLTGPEARHFASVQKRTVKQLRYRVVIKVPQDIEIPANLIDDIYEDLAKRTLREA